MHLQKIHRKRGFGKHMGRKMSLFCFDVEFTMLCRRQRIALGVGKKNLLLGSHFVFPVAGVGWRRSRCHREQGPITFHTNNMCPCTCTLDAAGPNPEGICLHMHAHWRWLGPAPLPPDVPFHKPRVTKEGFWNMMFLLAWVGPSSGVPSATCNVH